MTKFQTEGLQLYQKSTPLRLLKDFARICNISIFLGILGTTFFPEHFLAASSEGFKNIHSYKKYIFRTEN